MPDNWDEYTDWMNHGVTQGWISLPVCSTHDGLPMTPEEIDEWEDGYDTCIPALRIWNQ